MKIKVNYFTIIVFASLLALSSTEILKGQADPADENQRARDMGIKTGILEPGAWNAITDVEGVKVGHETLVEGEGIRTGVTVILPHGGNLFRERVPAAVYVGNGFGKAVGFTQIKELGELETPVGLTNTLSIHTVANGITDYVLRQDGNEQVRSVNPVVGETNDAGLNDIRSRRIESAHLFRAIEAAGNGPVAEGNVGAGTGTRALGFKAGIGTSSRLLPQDKGGYTVGVLVQSNFGGILSVNGAPVGRELGRHYMADEIPYDLDGSIMIVVATDAPLSPRNLERLAKRAFMGIAKVGGFASNGSGDYVIAFSTHPDVIRNIDEEGLTRTQTELKNHAMTPLFLAALEATEESILNSLFMAETMSGTEGRTMEALPVGEVMKILESYNAVEK